MKMTLKYTLLTFIFLAPYFTLALGSGTVQGQGQGFSLVVPEKWKFFESEQLTFKNVVNYRALVAQDTDLVSKTTKYFLMTVGTTSNVFGVHDTVVSRVSREELVDFAIDQMIHEHIDFVVTKTYTKGTGIDTQYIIEANYAVPRGRENTVVTFQFKNGKVFRWEYIYATGFSQFAPMLKGVSESVKVF